MRIFALLVIAVLLFGCALVSTAPFSAEEENLLELLVLSSEMPSLQRDALETEEQSDEPPVLLQNLDENNMERIRRIVEFNLNELFALFSPGDILFEGLYGGYNISVSKRGQFTVARSGLCGGVMLDEWNL